MPSCGVEVRLSLCSVCIVLAIVGLRIPELWPFFPFCFSIVLAQPAVVYLS